jgi:hypothetical protein
MSSCRGARGRVRCATARSLLKKRAPKRGGASTAAPSHPRSTMPFTEALPAAGPGPRAPVLSGLTRRRRGPDRDHGILTADKLSEFRDQAKSRRSSRTRAREPRPSPRTELTGTTRHRSQRHRAESVKARHRSRAPPQPHGRDGRDGPRTVGEPLLKLTALPPQHAKSKPECAGARGKFYAVVLEIRRPREANCSNGWW